MLIIALILNFLSILCCTPSHVPCSSSLDYVIIDSSSVETIGLELVHSLLAVNSSLNIRILTILDLYEVVPNRIRTYECCGLSTECNRAIYDDADLKATIVRLIDSSSAHRTATAIYHVVGDIPATNGGHNSSGMERKVQWDYYQMLNMDITNTILTSTASSYTYIGSWCKVKHNTTTHRHINDAYDRFVRNFCGDVNAVQSASQQSSIMNVRVVITSMDSVYGPGIRNHRGALNGIFNRVFMSTHHVGADRLIVVDQDPHEYVEYVYISVLIDHLIGINRSRSHGLKELIWVEKRITAHRLYALTSTIVGSALESNIRPCLRGSITGINTTTHEGLVHDDEGNDENMLLLKQMVCIFVDRSVRWKLSLDAQYDGLDEFQLDFHNFGYISPLLQRWFHRIDQYEPRQIISQLTVSLQRISMSNQINALLKPCPIRSVHDNHKGKKSLLFRHDGSHINLPYYNAYIPRLQQIFHICTCAKSAQCLKCKDELGGHIDVYLIGQSFMNFLKRNDSRFTTQEVRSISAQCYAAFLNKEYLELANKLSFIVHLRPDVVFTHHHNLTEFAAAAPLVSIARIPFATNVNEFNTYANTTSYELPYIYDVSTSGSANMINSLDYRSWYVHRGISLFQSKGINATLSGWTDSLAHYRFNMVTSKIWFSSSSMGDLVGVRAFEVMATNRTLLLFNRHYDKRMMRGLIDDQVAALFSSVEELIEKVVYYITHESERLHIVHNAYRRAMVSHDWTQRADLMAQYLNSC